MKSKIVSWTCNPYLAWGTSLECYNCAIIKDDFQTPLHSLSTPTFVSITQWNVLYCKMMFFIKILLPHLWGTLNSFSKFFWFLKLQSYWVIFIKWYKKEWGINLHIPNGDWHEIYVMYQVVAKCYGLCHLTWIKAKKHIKQTFKNAHYGLEIIFKFYTELYWWMKNLERMWQQRKH